MSEENPDEFRPRPIRPTAPDEGQGGPAIAPRRERPRFAMPKPAPRGLWRRVPPAIFPPLLGFLALALAWRQAASGMGVPVELVGLLEGIAVGLFAFSLFTYLVKLTRRPAVLADELTILPGRGGVFAAILGVYLLAGLWAPYGMGVARVLLVAGLLAHLVALGVLLRVQLAGPAEGRRVTPLWHLSWVGPIVAARVAPALEWGALAALIFWPALLAALVIWGLSLRQALKESVPAPLRPLLAVHLAPAALLASVALLIGRVELGFVFLALAVLGLVALLAASRWVLAGGFSPFWGALTFPLASTAAALWMLYPLQGTEPVRIFAGLVLIVATLAIPPILFLVMRSWARGELPVKTNAAIA